MRIPTGADPREGLSYPQSLNDSPVRLFFGAAVALSVFILAVPLIARFVLGIAYAVRGRPGEFADFYTAAMGYEFAEGIVASHLGLGFLIVVALVATRFFHGRANTWMWSVQPGFRWRYAVLCGIAALVVLNGVLWLSYLVLQAPVFSEAEPGWVYLALILVFTSPLQAVAEEVFFRGYLLQTVSSAAGNAWVGIVISALIFALMHGVQNPALFMNRFAFGVAAGWLVWKTGGLEGAIAAHVVNNLCAFGYAFFTGGIAAIKGTTQIEWGRSAFDVLAFVAFAVVAWWIGKKLHVATTTP